MKKGDLSLNTIVVAAIVLIVLVVMIVIFSGRLGGFTKGLNDCTNKNGEAKTISQGCTVDEVAIFKYKSTSDSPTEDYVCCLPIGKDKQS